MENEIWKDIPDYEGLYQASNLGRVKSLRKTRGAGKGYITKEKILSQVLDKYGYFKVHLCKLGKARKHIVNRVIATTFLGYSKLETDHINGIKTDNRIENLEFVSTRENQKRYQNRIGKSKSKHIGVSWHKYTSKWQSEIHYNKKTIYLGLFKNEDDAAKAYNNKLKELENEQ